ncbi:MAG: SDR family NAD(P)-dependent oxidoreductase [Magnetococcales bacterium]|nr:SDR family NAD(P)-dependent oxidoreductase [Magnetococcales bacterium]
MYPWQDEVLLVTGTTSGLGRALALEAAARKAGVIMLARSPDRLGDVAKEVAQRGGTPYPYELDLEMVERIPTLYAQIKQDVGKAPTILINNVGYQVAGFVQNIPVELYERSMRANFLAPVALMQCVLPDMLRQGKGVIGNIMSSIMYHAFPGVSPYAASKSALGAVHESLQIELTGKPVRTLLIRPGSFRSNYWKNTQVDDRIPGYTKPTGEHGRDPAFVANTILSAIEQNKSEVNLSTFKDFIGQQLSYFAPGLLRKVIARNNHKIINGYPRD